MLENGFSRVDNRTQTFDYEKTILDNHFFVADNQSRFL
jgi:hypothetical protein